MPKIHEKMMQTDFAKKLKKLIILTVCVVLLGGGLSTAMLAPQIREAVSSARQWEQDREKRREQDDGETNRRDDEKRRESDSGDRGNEEHDFFDQMTVTAPTPAALTAAGLTGLLLMLFLFLYWLLVAAWLYQSAVLSNMNGMLWLIAGLIGNVFAAVLFGLVRSFVRVKCPSCGSCQHTKTQYCTKCGAALRESCESCGADCAPDDKFCHTCGKKLHEKTV